MIAYHLPFLRPYVKDRSSHDYIRKEAISKHIKWKIELNQLPQLAQGRICLEQALAVFSSLWKQERAPMLLNGYVPEFIAIHYFPIKTWKFSLSAATTNTSISYY